MARPDWSEDEGAGFLAPGIYRAKVQKSEEKDSRKSGDPYFNVELAATDFGRVLCYDILMLAGKGRGIGTGKLEALGFERKTPEILAAELVGREAYVAVAWTTYEGKKRLKVDIQAEGAIFGYWPIVASPDGVTRPDKKAETEATPF